MTRGDGGDGLRHVVVDSAGEMAAAIGVVEQIDGRECRRVAEERFDARRRTSGAIVGRELQLGGRSWSLAQGNRLEGRPLARGGSSKKK